ncbi:MAG: dihydrodipicolinate synthase family protein, partial [Rubrivivax sp.]
MPAPTPALQRSDWPAEVDALLRAGTVIPAHPLALDAQRRLDPRRQRALTRYYLDAGAGGLAVGVHATQFAIRELGLYPTVLELAMQARCEWTDRPVVMIAGLSGRTAQAVSEARTARAVGYPAGMLSLAPMKGASVDELIAHCQAVGDQFVHRRPLHGRQRQHAGVVADGPRRPGLAHRLRGAPRQAR